MLHLKGVRGSLLVKHCSAHAPGYLLYFVLCIGLGFIYLFLSSSCHFKSHNSFSHRCVLVLGDTGLIVTLGWPVQAWRHSVCMLYDVHTAFFCSVDFYGVKWSIFFLFRQRCGWRNSNNWHDYRESRCRHYPPPLRPARFGGSVWQSRTWLDAEAS